MTKRAESHSDMAPARWSDGIGVIFDQKSPSSHHSRSRSPSSCSSTRSSPSSGSGDCRGRGTGGRHRSSSSSATSSSSVSSSRPRSRSHPRCRRRSSRCRCDNHRRSRSGHRHRSPRRCYRGRSRSCSRPRTPDSYSRHRRCYRSRSRSVHRWSRHRRQEGQFRHNFPQSPSRSYRRRSRSHSRSRSYRCSASLNLHDKGELLEAAKANAMKILGVEKLELPASVKPILSEQSDSRTPSPEPSARVRHDSERKVSQDTETEPCVHSPKMSSKGKITFSINNSVAKPTVATPSSAKVTPRVDSYESRKPYGHWIPISSRQTSSARKRT